MTILTYANNATTTLQAGIAPGATSCTLAPGTGSLFPFISSGQAFFMTFLDAATELISEIVLVTARVGDVCTIVRAQQGTTAKTWNAADIASQLVTAGDSENFIQGSGLQSGLYNYTPGIGTNSITATLQSALVALANGFQVIVEAQNANTGAATLTLTLGTTVQPAHAIVKGNGTALSAGDIPGVGYPIMLVFNGTNFVMTNPVTSSTANLAGGAANEIAVQTAPSTTGFIGAPAAADEYLHWNGSAFAWGPAVDSFNGRTGAVVPTSGDYTAAEVGAVSTASVTGSNQRHAANGFQFLPGGMLLQWGIALSAPPGNAIFTVTFPRAFPTACVGIQLTSYPADGTTKVYTYGTTSFQMSNGTGGNDTFWFAYGY